MLPACFTLVSFQEQIFSSVSCVFSGTKRTCPLTQSARFGPWNRQDILSADVGLSGPLEQCTMLSPKIAQRRAKATMLSLQNIITVLIRRQNWHSLRSPVTADKVQSSLSLYIARAGLRGHFCCMFIMNHKG